MRIRSRATVVAIIILALAMGLAGGLGVAQSQPSSLYPVNVTLETGEKILFAKHTDDLAGGNWIQLSDGTSITLPPLTFVYDGVNSASYTKDETTVTIESDFTQLQVTYPLSTHHIYVADQSMTAKFWGSTELSGEVVEFSLFQASSFSLSQVREMFNDVFQGDMTDLCEALRDPYWSTEVTLETTTGDSMVTFTAPSEAGEYLLIVLKDGNGSPYELYIYSATLVEVIDHALDVSTPSSVEKGDPVSIVSTLDGPSDSYIYGAIMIEESAYNGDVKISTDGTILGTGLYLNDEPIADGELVSDLLLGGVEQSDLFALAFTLMNTFDPSEFAFGFTFGSTTGSMSLSTSSIIPGDYILLVGVWKDLGSRIVGFKQKTITIEPPYKPSPTPHINIKPTADAGPNMKIPVGSTIYFSGAGSYDRDGYIDRYSWDFGDGQTASGKYVYHTYTEPGHYDVTLTVTDNRYAEDFDKCQVMVWQPPAPVASRFGQYVPGEQKGFRINALEEANTTVTLDTTDNVTVTVLRYEGNPHPGDPIPAMALPIYVDVEVSDPDAVVWPIYVEVSYTDEQIGELDENTFGIYYWMDDAWQRCSNTGVNTMKNIVWAYMTAHEASGSPILIAGMHAITPPPLPPFLDNLNITPADLELGDEVTISVDIMNPNDIAIQYMFEMQIEMPIGEQLNLLIDVELEAYESKTVSRAMTPTVVGTHNVTVIGMTGSFTVKAPPKPAEFIVSDLSITPEEFELGEGVEVWSFRITANVENVGEQEGTHTVDLKVDGDVIQAGTVILVGGESTQIIFDVTRSVGVYAVEVDGLTGSFTVTAHPKPPEFVVSDLTITPEEIEPGDEVTISVLVTNIGEETGDYTVTLDLPVGPYLREKTVSLEGGESERVEFEVSRDIEGIHDVTVDGLTGSFTVTEPPTVPVWWMRPGYMAGILILVTSAGAVIYYAWKAKLFSPTSSDLS